MDCIKKTISQNPSNKVFFNDDFSYLVNENGSFYYEDKFGGLKLPMPNVLGQFQLENISTAIATLRTLDLGIKDEHIQRGITKISSLARLQEIKSGKLKELVKNNKLIVDGSHNEDGARALNEYLQTLNCNKHIIIGMMANKLHEKYISYFKDIASLRTIDIPNQPNSISGKDLKEKFKSITNVQYQPDINQAIKSIDIKEGDLLLITGSLYLAGEVLNLN
jgi:dihydrofolate synthase/folylpolyglutamate synthase